jgi:quercetin dioxygenase-like cupin family protein
MTKKILTYILTLFVPLCGHTQPAVQSQELVTELNGSIPPEQIARSLKEVRLLSSSDGKGNQVIVEQTTRAAKTRTPIHMHDHGGITCVIEGEMTLYMEGVEPKRAQAGECYYMPTGRMMAGVNSGYVQAVMHDTFILPKDAAAWRVVEKGTQSYQDQFDKHH